MIAKEREAFLRAVSARQGEIKAMQQTLQASDTSQQIKISYYDGYLAALDRVEKFVQESGSTRKIDPLDKAVIEVADAMSLKLHQKKEEGFEGWDDPANKTRVRLRLHEHFARFVRGESHEIDCMNLLMMLWRFRIQREANVQRIHTAIEEGAPYL